MIKDDRNPYGYRNLLAYKRADALQSECAKMTACFPKAKTLIALADQMNRSARSAKQNIVEGWRRNSTGEYYHFLGYSIGSNAELHEDCNDIWDGKYYELKQKREIMGEKGEERGNKGVGDIEKLQFYPLDAGLPPVVQLKLRAKELNFLLEKLQKSLAEKMGIEKTFSDREQFRRNVKRARKEDDAHEKYLKETIERAGYVRLKNGQVVEKDSKEAVKEREEKRGKEMGEELREQK